MVTSSLGIATIEKAVLTWHLHIGMKLKGKVTTILTQDLLRRLVV